MATGEAGKKKKKSMCEGKRESPQGNKLRFYFLPMGCIMSFLVGLLFLISSTDLCFPSVARGLVRNTFMWFSSGIFRNFYSLKYQCNILPKMD